MNDLEQAQAALANFEETLAAGHPWVPGLSFIKNPGLDQHILYALQSYVHYREVQEQAKPAKRVSLSDNPNWRPSCVAPVLPGSKDWVDVDGKNDDQGQARSS